VTGHESQKFEENIYLGVNPRKTGNKEEKKMTI
jgi:hypothetical protein